MNSLRLRLLLLAAVVMTAALVVTGLVITQLFTLHLERRVGQELDTHIEQLAGGLRIGPSGEMTLERAPLDPRFARIFGGLYWQVVDATTGASLRSRSLWDSSLQLPDELPEPGVPLVHDGVAPNGAQLLVHERVIIVPRNGGEETIRLAVGIERGAIDALEAGFASDMVPALAVLGAVLLAGFAVQVTAGLRPLQVLRRALGAVRLGETDRIEWLGPREVAPLVEEVNSLLARQEQEVTRARDRAADLAHGLKTPLTAMAGDVRRLREAGQDEIADDLDAIAEQMRRHVERELARARIRHGSYVRPTLVMEAAEAVRRSISRTPEGERVAIDIDIPASLSLPLDPADLTELLGNLVENAVRHARQRVRVVAGGDRSVSRLLVEDDGPGIADEDLDTVIERGRRLDTAGPSSDSTGLGLAIVADIVAAYGGELILSRSELGGLAAGIAMPLAPTA